MTGSGDRNAGGRGGARARAEAGGGRAGAAIFGNVPLSVFILAAVLALVCVGMWLAPEAVEEAIGERYGLSPARLAAGGAAAGGWFWAIAPLFTHAFIHATGTHLLFNLLWLLVFGTPVARRFGSAVRFFLFFALCSAGGGAFFSLFHLNDPTLLIGASGGISGLLGGLVRFAFHRPRSKPESAKGVLPLTDKSVLIWSAVVIAMNASIAIFGAGMGAGDADIAWQAHVGGFLVGLLAFPLFDPARK